MEIAELSDLLSNTGWMSCVQPTHSDPYPHTWPWHQRWSRHV